MANKTTTAVQQPAAPARPATVSAAPVASVSTVAGGPGKALPPSPTEVQQDAEAAFMDMAMALAGGQPGADDETPAKPAAKKKAPEPTHRATQADAEDEPEETADTEDEDDDTDAQAAGERPILSDDDDTEDQDEADGDGDATGKSFSTEEYEAKLYKAREAKRALKEKLAEAETKVQALEQKMAEAVTATTPALTAQNTGFFRDVKNTEELNDSVAWLEQRLAHLEDNEDGFTEADEQGNEIDRDPKWVRKQIRAVQHQLKLAGQVEKHLNEIAARQNAGTERAKKLYPFVFNPQSKLHDTLLEVVKEHPEVNHAPDKALVLGRLTLAKLVEKGEWAAVPKAKAAAAAAATPRKTNVPAASPPPKRERRTAEEDQQPTAAASGNPARRVMDARSPETLDWALRLVGGGAE